MRTGSIAPTVAFITHYLVGIHGDAHRAIGLLAVAGIQNIASREEPTERVTARLSAESPEGARGRVLAALVGESFTLGEPRPD
jgi:hypothetical protein